MADNDAMEVLTPSALESIERAQIDVQVATAHRFPRSLAKFKQRAMEMVQQDLETAESCIYSRPVGKGEDGKQKYAEGASIRMAEIVASCFGNIRFGARVIEQTERFVKCEGVCHDLESNTAGKSEAMESTVKRNGQPYDERMRIVVAKACLSKALRDAIFRVVPRALCKSITDAAAQVISKQAKTIAQRQEAAKKWLASIGVDDARVFAVLGVAGWPEVGEEQLLQLTGIRTAMKDEGLTPEEAFPSLAGTGGFKPPQPPPPPVAPQPSAPSAPTAPPAGSAQDESPNASTTAAQESQPEAAQDAGKPVSEPPTSPPPPANPLPLLKKRIDELGVLEGQLMKYLQNLPQPLARKTQNGLSELSDKKLATILASLDDPAVVEDVRKA